MRRLILLCLLLVLTTVLILAQDEDESGLTTGEVLISTGTDAFGQPTHAGRGVLTNNDDVAYQNISVFADLYNAADEVIGEGFGIPANACGAGLLPDFALQPGASQPFNLAFDFFGEETEIERIELFPEGVETEPEQINLSQVFQHIRVVDDREVVNVEWIDPNSFRYAVGCDADVFSNQEWFRYDIDTDSTTRILHPNEEGVTESLLRQIGLEEPDMLNRSYLTFSPTSRRIVYQNDINTVVTAEPDGSFKRLIYEDLSRFSLHGFIWLPEGRFLAYYYGAIGDPVRYFTASVEGQRISGDIDTNAPSLTVPGVTPDGVRTVVTFDLESGTGYYLFHTISKELRLLFEAEPAGNNWPAPIVVGDQIGASQIYIVRPVDGQARLQCFDVAADTLTDLTALPLDLSTDDRAWTWISPDGNTMALAANGLRGGVWLVGIAALGGCDGEV